MPESIPFNRQAELMQANLMRVFNERETSRRLKALDELYTADAVLYEPEAIATGRAEISSKVEALLSTLPADFGFTSEGPAVGHHNLWRLRWRAGPLGAPVVITGTDVAQFRDGRISALYVLLDPQ